MPGHAKCCLWLCLLLGMRAQAQDDVDWVKGIEALIADGQLPVARARLAEEETRRGPSYPVLLLEARLQFAAGRFAESLAVLARCRQLKPDDPQVYTLMGLSAARLDRFTAAEAALKNASRLAPDDALPHLHLGALYYTRSLFLAARPELAQAVALNPRYLPARIFLGLTEEEVGEEPKALETYRQAARLDEAAGLRNELPYLYLGRLLYRLARLSEALEPLSQATQINPRSAESWLLLGKALNGTGRTEEAVAAFRKSAETDPRNPEPHYLLSRAYLLQHRSELARQELDRFHQLQGGKTAGGEDPGRRAIR